MSHSGWNRQAEALLIRSACTSLPQATKLALFIYRAFFRRGPACPAGPRDNGRARDVCFILKQHLNEQDTSKIMEVFKLLGNLCLYGQTIIRQDIFAYSFPLQGKTQTGGRLIPFRRINLLYLCSTPLISHDQTARSAISLRVSFIMCRN